jgi:hypothetical protein
MQPAEIEELILQFLVTLPADVQKQIVNHEVNLLDSIDEESEYEIKEELWRLACYAISLPSLVSALKDLQPESDDESETESASDSE